MLPLVLLISVHEGHFSLPLIPILIIVAYSGNRLACIIAIEQQEIVVTTFWIFVYVFLGLRPFLQILVGIFPWLGNYEETLLVEAGFVILVGILAFDTRHRFLPRQAAAIVTPEFFQRPIRKTTVALLAVLAITSAIYLQQQLGGMVFMPLWMPSDEGAVSSIVQITVGATVCIFILYVFLIWAPQG
jgi:hypothetical protein